MSDLSVLQSLPSLPKAHYGWRVPGELLVPIDPRVVEFARITKGVSIASYAPYDVVRNAVSVAKATGTNLAVNHSPFHNAPGWNDLDGTPDAQNALYVGPELEEEIRLFRLRMCNLRRWVAAEKAGVAVELVILDAERFKPKVGYDAWNDELDRKYNLFYSAAKKVFPAAQVEWFERGSSDYPTFTTREKGDAFSFHLYFVAPGDEAVFSDHYIRDLIGLPAGTPLNIWVSLGEGYQSVNGQWVWANDLKYSEQMAWTLGAMLHNRPHDCPTEFYCCDWSPVSRVLLYPGPFEGEFYMGSPRATMWLAHFAAYVKGANGIAL